MHTCSAVLSAPIEINKGGHLSVLGNQGTKAEPQSWDTSGTCTYQTFLTYPVYENTPLSSVHFKPKYIPMVN